MHTTAATGGDGTGHMDVLHGSLKCCDEVEKVVLQELGLLSADVVCTCVDDDCRDSWCGSEDLGGFSGDVTENSRLLLSRIRYSG